MPSFEDLSVARVITMSILALLTLGVGMAQENVIDALGRFNVRQYGAKGDGQNDDTKAFQMALDAAAKVSGTVFVPTGVYRVGELTWHDHTSMAGDPGWAYYVPGGSVLELNDPNVPCLIDFTYCKGATAQRPHGGRRGQRR